jgi:hypothetical protein
MEIVFKEKDVTSVNVKGIVNTITDFFDRYDAALLSLDVGKVNEFLKAQNASPIPDNEVGLLAIHVARARSGRLPESARTQSIEWLKERMKPTPLLDDVMCKSFYVQTGPGVVWSGRDGGVSSAGGNDLPRRCELPLDHEGKHKCTRTDGFFRFMIQWD